MTKPVVLAFIRHYLPGYKSGGPVRTISNLVQHLGDEVEFRIVTSDRDLGDNNSYAGVTLDSWTAIGKATVIYLSPQHQGMRGFARLLRQTSYDAVYLNSFFDPVFASIPLLLRRLGLVPRKPYIVAPRGEFSPGALQLKVWKKRIYLAATRFGGLNRDIVWHASSAHEATNIRNTLGVADARISIAPNPASLAKRKVETLPRWSSDGTQPLKVLFLSRISPKKNLLCALQVLAKVREPVVFSIYGPVTDEAYWRQCQAQIARLPGHIAVAVHGAVHPDRVPEIMSGHDLFFLPTLGENYGHVIAEALSAGTPLLIGDTTPWRDLEAAGVGWDLPLEHEDRFVGCIEHCAKLGSEEYDGWRQAIRRYAISRLGSASVIAANRDLFLGTLSTAE